MLTLTPTQHQLLTAALTEEVRHLLECRDLDVAKVDGRVSRQELAEIRHTAALDAKRLAGRAITAAVHVLATNGTAAAPPKPSLGDLLQLAASDCNDEGVRPWPRF